MGLGRRQRLSPADRVIWERLKETVAPLHPVTPEGKPPSEPVAHPLAKPGRTSSEKPDLPRRILPGLHSAALPRPDHAPSQPPSPRMDRKRFEKLRRGRLDPEARIDLHGMTAERAHGALTGFVAQAHASGLRLVLVITGKGRSTSDVMAGDGAQGILRRNVPLWLTMPPNSHRILHMAAAHRRHGGEGAFYVYLARSRTRGS